MLGTLGTRQQALLRLLLEHKAGLTTEELATQLGITRTAVRQHLAALGSGGLVATGPHRASGGRPQQLYVLSEAGKEQFPRGYAWLAELIVDSIRQDAGAPGLRERLQALGARVGRRLRGQGAESKTPQQAVAALAGIMEGLGYSARSAGSETGTPTIEASNCIFHTLAMKDPDICQFDLAMLSAYTGRRVDHQECMARGGNVCRFRFHRNDADEQG